MKKIMGLMAAVAFGATLAQASVSLNMYNGFFYENDGSTPLSLNSTIVLLADANNNGFGDLTQATTSWTADAGDVVLARWNLNENAEGAGTSFDAVIFDYAGLTAGYDMLLVWYDKTYSVGDVGPGEGVYFGTFRTDDVISYSTINWSVPTDGGLYDLNFMTAALAGGTGESLESAGIAQYQTIPEPATAVLAVIGGGLAYFVRRAKRFHNYES